MMPELDRRNYKYNYVRVTHRGVSTKSWIVQVAPSQEKQESRESICRWTSCLQSVDTAHKVQIRSKKKDQKRLVRSDNLCLFHKLLNRQLKVSVGPLSNELWNAALSGVNWQQDISGHSIIGQLLQGKMRETLQKHLDSMAVSLAVKKIWSDVPALEYQHRLKEDIADLNHSLAQEKEFLKELRDFVQECQDTAVVSRIHRILKLKPSEKLDKLRQFKLSTKNKAVNRPSSAKNSNGNREKRTRFSYTRNVKFATSPYLTDFVKIPSKKVAVPHGRVALKINRVKSASLLEGSKAVNLV